MKRSEIALRIAKPEDAQALLDIYAYYVGNTAITYEYDVPAASEFAERIEQTLSRFPYIVAEYGGRTVGYAYAGRFNMRRAADWDAETSIYVDRDMRGRGIGSALYTALEKMLAAQNIVNLFAKVNCPDEDDEYLTRDSFNFHKYVGYELVGIMKYSGYKFNRWYNMAYMEKSIAEHRKDQPDMKPFPDIRALAEKIIGNTEE